MIYIKSRTSLQAAALLLIATSGFAADLQKCPSDTEVLWDNCTGSYSYSDGGQYVGAFKEDNRHGQGIYTFESGTTYTGEWHKGLYHGQGTLTKADGTVETGIWKDDILQPPEGLFRVVGTKLYFDTENTVGVDEINHNHDENLFVINKLFL